MQGCVLCAYLVWAIIKGNPTSPGVDFSHDNTHPKPPNQYQHTNNKHQDDRRYLGLSGSALFQDSFVAQEYERLPAFEGTELPAASAEDEEAGRKDGQGASSVEVGGWVVGRPLESMGASCRSDQNL